MASAQSLSFVWSELRSLAHTPNNTGVPREHPRGPSPAAVAAMMLKCSIFLGTTWMNHQERSTGDLLMPGKLER